MCLDHTFLWPSCIQQNLTAKEKVVNLFLLANNLIYPSFSLSFSVLLLSETLFLVKLSKRQFLVVRHLSFSPSLSHLCVTFSLPLYHCSLSLSLHILLLYVSLSSISVFASVFLLFLHFSSASLSLVFSLVLSSLDSLVWCFRINRNLFIIRLIPTQGLELGTERNPDEKRERAGGEERRGGESFLKKKKKGLFI